MGFTLGVLITYHNEGELLGECIDSLLAGPEAPEEILIYDDASDFPASEYIPAGRSIRVIRGEENHGPSYGRNVLLRASQSDYIHFHDADDLFRPQWCQQVRRRIAETRVDVILTEVSSYRGQELKTERVLGLERHAAGDDLVRFCLRGSMLVPAGTYRRSSVLALGGYRETLWQSEDFDFHVRLAASGASYSVITEPLVVIRIRSAGRSQNRREVWESAVEAIEILALELPQQYKADLADAAARAGSALFKLGDRAEAREAFSLAYKLGAPSFAEQRRFYRVLAKICGPETAERWSLFYRTLMPGRFRQYLAECGW
ncbi:MAG: glycosyltransferase [Deltaproteobacteria bacterium]|nr:glycosyltransferase [Deltaproteobacteria bacterium]